MAEVTVEQLAKTVGTDPDKLLSQMKDAGLPHNKADEGVSDDDKRTLLAHLKRSHGSEEAAPRKITLKRKSVSTLKTGGAPLELEVAMGTSRCSRLAFLGSSV